MVYLWTPLLQSFLLFFLATSTSHAILLQDGHPSRQCTIVAFEGKVDICHFASEDDVLEGRRMKFDAAIVLLRNSVREDEETPKMVISRGVSQGWGKEGRSKNNKGGKGRKVRRLLRRRVSNVNDFVAYADYHDPQYHPPINN
ncbi:hypothetical protein Nepgr_017081 [Nepenthes gracilis]|uniref:Uncharacterized protein n=1 Tax=Nepenthes gracilis TaxID=150966 RepID=A0AAD3XT28_NEPGR|nr:hypothetical protein Nepgr_017081 [Nepenthes gracilis]